VIIISGGWLPVANSLSQCMKVSIGSMKFEPYERIWKTWALVKCMFFVWLVAHNNCWCVDHLAQGSMVHPDKCPLCDREEKNNDHLLLPLCHLFLISFQQRQGCIIFRHQCSQAHSIQQMAYLKYFSTSEKKIIKHISPDMENIYF
jgi:hypothetical protein